MGVSTQLAH